MYTYMDMYMYMHRDQRFFPTSLDFDFLRPALGRFLPLIYQLPFM